MNLAISFLDFSLRSLLPALFIFAVVIVLIISKAIHVAYHRGRRDYRDEHFTAVIRADDSARERV